MHERHIGSGPAGLMMVLFLVLAGCGDDGVAAGAGDAAMGGDGGITQESDGATADAGAGTDATMAGDSGGDASAPVTFASCDVPISGVDFGEGAGPEAQPGVEEALDAVDVDSLPASVDISGIMGFFLGFVAYALETPVGDLGTTLDRDATLAKGPLGRVVLASIAAGQGDALGLDFELFRRGFHRYYTCSKGFSTTLDGFLSQVYDFSSLSTHTVDSAAKCGPRRIRADLTAGVHVAETLVDGVVRETEILLTRSRSDGQIDFVVYDANGVLTDRSVFPTMSETEVVGASPYVCMGCHVENSGPSTPVTFETVHPDLGICN